MTRHIDEQRAIFGVELICRELAIAPSPTMRPAPGHGTHKVAVDFALLVAAINLGRLAALGLAGVGGHE